VVLPATRPERVKILSELLESESESETYIISPGVHAQGADPGDAVTSGADYEIVGRAIYQSENPKDTAEQIYMEIIDRLQGD